MHTSKQEFQGNVQNLTVGPPTRRILIFSIPLLLGNLFQQVYQFTDAAVVGRMVGVQGLAAVGAAGAVVFLLIGFSWGASGGLAIPVARAFGAGDMRAMRRSAAAGALVSIVIALVITIIGVIFSRSLLELMHTPAEILDDSTIYLTVTFAGMATVVAYNYFAATLRAIGDSRTPLIFLIAASLLNAALVYLFVGIFHLGVAGAAITTVIAQGASALGCLAWIWKRVPALHLSRDDWQVTGAEVRDVLRTGLPMGFQMSIIAIGALTLQFAVNGLGATSVAAFTAAMRADQFAIAPLGSFGIAMVTYVAQNRGARQWKRIRVGLFRMNLVAVAASLILGALLVIFARPIAGLFVGHDQVEVINLVRTFFIVTCTLYPLVGILFVNRNALQGMGISSTPTIAGVLELVARVVAALVLVHHFGFVGVALAGPLAWVFALPPVAWRWRYERRRLRELESTSEHHDSADSSVTSREEVTTAA
jgi:putative MATE family efflux protein